jgi:HopA1 effector protein family
MDRYRTYKYPQNYNGGGESSRLPENSQRQQEQSGSARRLNSAYDVLQATSKGRNDNGRHKRDVTVSSGPAERSIDELAQKMFETGVKDENEIYEIYRKHPYPEQELTKHEKNQYFQELSDISYKYNKSVDSYPQELSDSKMTTHKFLDRFPPGKIPEEDGYTFYHASARDVFKKKSISRARLSVRLRPLRATEVFDYVSGLVASHPDIISAKLAGPSIIHSRTDSMIIYLKSVNLDDAQKIADDLKKKFNDGSYFRSGAPAGMCILREGIGYSSDFDTQKSHGQMIAEVLATARQKYDHGVTQPGQRMPSSSHRKALISEAFRTHKLKFHDYGYDDGKREWFDRTPDGRLFWD